MTELIGYIILGIPFGCVFALVAVGLVLTYKTSGVFNLAFAAQAFASAAVYYDLKARHEWPIIPAFLIAVVVVAPLIGLILDRAAVPPPADRARDRQARHLARIARRDAADREALVRGQPRVRAADDLAQPVRALLVRRLRARWPPDGDAHRHRDRGARAHGAVPLHHHRPADAGGGGEPAADRARRRQRRPGEHVLPGCCRA